MFVCPSVCLSARISRKPDGQFHQISRACCLAVIILWRYCDTLCISGFAVATRDREVMSVCMHDVLGVIIFYELWLKPADARSLPRLVFNPSGQYDPLGQPTVLPPPETSHTVYGLQAFSEYELQVVAENTLGKTASDCTTGLTGEAGNALSPAFHRAAIQGRERMGLGARPPSGEFSPPPNATVLASPNFGDMNINVSLY